MPNAKKFSQGGAVGPKRSDGFSLIEMAIVFIVFGFVMGAVLYAAGLYLKQRDDSMTQESLEQSRLALDIYAARFGAYPCPADPTLAPGTPRYEVENRATPGDTATNCNNPSTPGVQKDENGNPIPVVTGAIPFKTIAARMSDPDGDPATSDSVLPPGFSRVATFDASGNRLTYAVTLPMTNSNSYNDFDGSIDVRDENNQSLMFQEEDTNGNGAIDGAEIDYNRNGRADVGRYAHFVLVSHGSDAAGAYSPEGGAPVQPCPAAPAPPTLNESENCDNDAIFMRGLRNDSPATYYDDTVVSEIRLGSELWRLVELKPPASGVALANNNKGQIALGDWPVGLPVDPTEMMHVKGDVKVDGANGKIRVPTTGQHCVGPNCGYCDANGQNCMQSDLFKGTVADARMNCPAANQAIYKIENNQVYCLTAFGGLAGRVCPAGLFLHGIVSTASGGRLICCDPSLSSCGQY